MKSSIKKSISNVMVILLVLSIMIGCVGCGGNGHTHETENTSPTEVTDVTESGGNVEDPTEESTHDTKPYDKDDESADDGKHNTTEGTEPAGHVHEYSKKNVEATCEEQGYTVYTCDCGDTYNDNYVDAKGHAWSNWVTTKEPTESATGSAQRKCGRCSASETKELPKVIPNHTHKYTAKETTAATCTKAGVMTYTCSCGESYTEPIDALGHDYGKTVTNPTCTAKGYTTYTCKNCHDSYKADYTSPKGHSYTSKVTKEATCKENGVRTYTCSKCKDSYTESISNSGISHTWGSWSVTKAPTCSQKGNESRSCSVCGKTESRDISATGKHSWGDWYTTKEPTETSTGTAERKCSVCGAKETKTLDKLPESHKHSYTGKVTKEATCTEDGVKTYVCECGDVDRTESIPKTGHSYSVTSTKAGTCCEAGYKTYTCSKCSDSYTESTGTTEHSWVHHHTDEVGHEEAYYVCHCGGWSWKISNGDWGDSWFAHLEQFESTAGHSYYATAKWVVDTPASDYYKCSVCGATK